MFFIFLLIGIFLVILDIPVLIKVVRTKGTAEKLKQKYKIAGIVFLLGAVFIGCAFWARADNQKNEFRQIECLIKGTDNSDVKKYIVLFINKRPRMIKYISAIQSIDADFSSSGMNYTAEEYGWSKEIYLMIKLKEKTNLPGSWQKANGQTLHYILGGGPNAGVIAKKDVSQYFADMPIDESADSFIPMPELAGIDNIDL